MHTFADGLKDGIPIGLGYLSVSFTFGMMAVMQGIPVWAAVAISMTNLTSAGQFAGLSLIAAGAPAVEMALTQLVINLRYALMSLSLSQKLVPATGTAKRCLIAFGNTDEIFAVASGKAGKVSTAYMVGLMTVPYIGWAAGTLIGGVASTLLPEFIRSALGIAIYGMFIAIIIPPARKQKPVRAVLLVAIVLSLILHFVPLFAGISEGFIIIICAILASALGAWLFPVEEANR